MSDLAQKIHAILFYKNTAVSKNFLIKTLEEEEETIIQALEEVSTHLQNSGLSLIESNGEYSLGTSPETSSVIEKIVKDELSGELSKASVETLSIISYKGPISRKEIDYIRGVNSAYIIRALEIRGLIEKQDGSKDRGSLYIPTREFLAFMGITKREEMPEFNIVMEEIRKFEESKETKDEAEKPQEETQDV